MSSNNRYIVIDKDGQTVIKTWNIDAAKDIALEVSLFEGSSSILCGDTIHDEGYVIEYVDGVKVYEGA